MRFSWHMRVAVTAVPQNGAISAQGKLLMPWPCRIHKWEVTFNNITFAGGNGTVGLFLNEYNNLGLGAFVNSGEILACDYTYTPAGVDGSSLIDFGDEGLPLPYPVSPTANGYYILGLSTNGAGFGAGTVRSILDFTFDYPYEKARPVYVR